MKVKPTYPPLTTTTAEGYSIPTLIVSPAMEFKGLTAGPSPPDSNFVSELLVNFTINLGKYFVSNLGAHVNTWASGTLRMFNVAVF